MRELNSREVEQVSGGLGLLTGAAGAALNGGFAGLNYATQASIDGNFTWSGFTYTVASNATAGFLIGTGASLVVAAATGAARGAAVLGVSMIGVGGAITVSSGVSSPSEIDGGS